MLNPITPQTTIAELEQWAISVRDLPCKPTSITVKFLACVRSWSVTICMPGGPVIGNGADLIAAINDALEKVKQ